MENTLQDDIIDTREAGRILGIHYKTVQVLLNRGELPGTRIGGKNWRMRRSAIYNLIPTSVPSRNG